MILINKVLKERYKLTELIAEGGMASVYKGTDLLLQRTVAIKVLKQNLALDKDGIERFYREARSAAKLSHPNIINVYDIGSEEQIYFIVMEYLPGGTLDKMVKENEPIQIKEVIKIGIEICEALLYAHEKGVIHRDIKPQNIMLTEEKNIKVVDFGIARPLDSLTMTSPGTIIGSVYYFAPEQAEGHETTNLSDIYSTGVLLYYLATGKFPFDGENAVAIALKHIKETPASPRILRPDMPEELEAIILKAMSKKPENRQNGAGVMLKELKSLQEMFYKKTKKITDHTLLKSKEDNEKTIVRKSLPPAPDKLIHKEDLEEGESEKEGFKLPPFLLLIIVGLVIIIGIALGIYVSPLLNKPATVADGSTVKVPSLKGKTESEAREELEFLKLELLVLSKIYSDEIPPGLIISQDPSPGTEMKTGDKISVVISEGEEKIKVPYITGKTIEEARDELDLIGLDILVEEEQVTNIYPSGKILSQDPKAGTEVEENTIIKVKISKKAEDIIIPELTGLTEEEAEKILKERNLLLKVEGEKSSDREKGLIMEQDPPAGGKISTKSLIKVFISSGPEKVTVPDITQLTLAQAQEILKDLKLEIKVTGDEAEDMNKAIISTQSPLPGEELSTGDIIEITLKVPSDMVTVPDVTGLLIFEGKDKIQKENLTIGEIIEMPSNKTPGTILSQSPGGGSEIEENSPVNLVIAKEEAGSLIKVPDLTGLNVDSAIKELERSGLRSGKITEITSDEEDGTVVAQDPGAGSELKVNGEVNLIISVKTEEIDNKTIIVPNLIGKKIDSAIKEIEKSGLTLGSVETKKLATGEKGIVLEQDPLPGVTVEDKKEINLKICE